MRSTHRKRGKIHLPQEDMHTTAYWVALEDAAWAGLDPAQLQAGLWGMAHPTPAGRGGRKQSERRQAQRGCVR